MTAKERVEKLNPISFKEELEQAFDDHAKEAAELWKHNWEAVSRRLIEYKDIVDEMASVIRMAKDGHPAKGSIAVEEMEKVLKAYLNLKTQPA